MVYRKKEKERKEKKKKMGNRFQEKMRRFFEFKLKVRSTQFLG